MPKVSLLAVVAALVAVGCGVDPPATSPTPLPAHGTPAKIELSATSGVGEHGGTATVTARVLDAYSLLLPDVSVAFSANTGTFSAATVATNSSGMATTTLTADPGTVKVTAAAGSASASELPVSIQPVNIFVPPPSGPVPPLPLPDPKPQPPTPQYGVVLTALPSSVVTGVATTLSATVSPVFGAPPVTSWVWDCDIATPATDATTPNSAPCTYATAGTFTASVRVTGGGTVGFATTTVTVTTPPPVPVPSYTVAVVAAPSTIAAGGSSTLTATVTRVNGATPPTSWVWDCGTSTPPTDPAAVITTSCTYPAPGVFIAKVTVKDSSGTITGTATADVNVTPAVPPVPTVPVVAVHCAQPTPPALPALTVNCNVSATLDGVVVPSGSIVAANWDFGDTVTAPSTTNAATHTYGAANTYIVSVTNVSVPGTTAKGSGSVSVVVQ